MWFEGELEGKVTGVFVSTGSIHGGHEADVTASEMQAISAGSRGMIHSETNPLNRTERHYQMWFVPERPDTEFAYYQLDPAPGKREGQLSLYVSPDGQGGTMPVNTDAFVCVGLFSAGDTTTHQLLPDRGAWVQVVQGSLSVNGIHLQRGDGAGLRKSGTLNLSFAEESHVLLIDVGMDASQIW